MGYELTPTDLQEMLHGEKVTSSEKALIWKKDGKETAIRGRLVLTEEYKVRIAPKLKSKEPTDKACPKCKAGKLQLITAIDGAKWYGCNGYPQCRFTKPFIPHTFKTAPLKNNGEGAKAGVKKAETDAGHCDSSNRQGQPVNLSFSQKTSARGPAISDTSDGNGTQLSGLDRYQRIPKFVRELLKLDGGRSIKSSHVPPSDLSVTGKTEPNLKP